MQPLTNFIILAAAGIVAASPIEQRQSTPVLKVTLSNSASAVSEQYNASTDSSAISVASSTTTYDGINVGCLEICLPEYHCTLYDKSLTAIMDVNPGDTALSSLEIGQVTCASGLASTKRSLGGTTTTTKRSKRPRQWSWRSNAHVGELINLIDRRRQDSTATTYDGEAVFTDASSGAQTTVGFHVGQNATVGSGATNMSAATVAASSLTNGDTAQAFTCVAYDGAGADMGTFFGTERYSYSFVPGVVAWFLCATGT